MPVIDVGTRVLIGPEDDPITGVVTALLYRGVGGCYVQYEVAYWDGKTRHSAWFDVREVRSSSDHQQRLGF